MTVDDYMKAMTADLKNAIRRALSDAAKEEIHTIHLAGRLLEALPPTVAPTATSAAQTAVKALAATPPDQRPPAGRFKLVTLLRDATGLQAELKADSLTVRLLLLVLLTPGRLTDPLSRAVIEAMENAGLSRDVLLSAEGQPTAGPTLFTYETLGFGTDLRRMAEERYWGGCPVVGRMDEMEQILEVLGAAQSAVLTGPPGVGKTSLVMGLAYHLHAGTFGADGGKLRLVAVTREQLLSGTGPRGALEERVGRLVEHVLVTPGVIPFFDELHSFLAGDDDAARQIGEQLKPHLASGKFCCIGVTTDQEYVRHIIKNPALDQRFEKVPVPEPTKEEAVNILAGERSRLPAKLTIPDESLVSAVELSSEHYRDEALPRKAVKLLRRAASRKMRRLERKPTLDKTLTHEDLAGVIADARRVPVDMIGGDRVGRLLGPGGARERILARVVGQPTAIEEVVRWLALHADGCVEPRNPIGRFLFLGPPGCGKSELARAVAEEVVRDQGVLIEKNMAEYQGEGASALFMGAMPGYVGYGETNTLFSQVRMRPYSVVILDEIEKAHRSLLPVLMAVFDGWAEDGQGIGVDFSQCVFVLTSNLLADAPNITPTKIDGMAQLGDDELRVRLATTGRLPQPLLDRIDRVVFFNRLRPVDLRAILQAKVAARAARNPRAIPKGFLDRADAIVEAVVRETGGTGRDLVRALMRELYRAKQEEWQSRFAAPPNSAAKGEDGKTQPKKPRR